MRRKIQYGLRFRNGFQEKAPENVDKRIALESVPVPLVDGGFGVRLVSEKSFVAVVPYSF